VLPPLLGAAASLPLHSVLLPLLATQNTRLTQIREEQIQTQGSQSWETGASSSTAWLLERRLLVQHFCTAISSEVQPSAVAECLLVTPVDRPPSDCPAGASGGCAPLRTRRHKSQCNADYTGSCLRLDRLAGSPIQVQAGVKGFIGTGKARGRCPFRSLSQATSQGDRYGALHPNNKEPPVGAAWPRMRHCSKQKSADHTPGPSLNSSSPSRPANACLYLWQCCKYKGLFRFFVPVPFPHSSVAA
jgi:hypothetical protein